MTATSFTTAFWDVEDSGRVQAVQIRSRVIGTDAWSVVAERADPAAGQLTFTSDGADLDLEVQIRYRMMSGVYGAWTGASIHTAPAPGSYPALEGKPSKLGDINSGEGGKLQGIEAGADVTGTHTAKDTANVGGVPTPTFVNRITVAESTLSEIRADFKTANDENARQLGVANTKIDSATSTANAALTATGTLTTNLASVSQKTDKVSVDLTTEVKQRTDAVTAVNQRVDNIVAQGTNGTDTFARSEIQRVETAYIDADKAFALADQTLRTEFTNLNTATNTKFDNSVRLLSDAVGGIGVRTTSLETTAAGPSNSLNKNPDFASWSSGQSLPTGWEWWANVAGITRMGRSGEGGYAAKIDCGAIETGICVNNVTIAGGWVVMEADVYLESGDWSGSGLTLSGVYNYRFDSQPDTNGVAGNDPNNRRRRFSYLVQVASNPYNIHAMNNYSPLGPSVAKSLHWYRCAVRAATDGEIKAQKADAALNNPGGVYARLSSVETVTTNGTFATANRADTLEAQMNGGAGSNLLSRATSSASAYTDGKFGAANGRMDIMVSEYNGIGATVNQQAGTLARVDGRTRAYVTSTAVAGNNRAQIAIYADSNGGAGVDIIGDVTFRGSLSVGTGRSGARTEITDGGMRVFDANNVLRVVIGVF